MTSKDIPCELFQMVPGARLTNFSGALLGLKLHILTILVCTGWRTTVLTIGAWMSQVIGRRVTIIPP